MHGWTAQQWSKYIIFSDKNVLLFKWNTPEIEKLMFRRINESFHRPNIILYGAKRNIMVWAVIPYWNVEPKDF